MNTESVPTDTSRFVPFSWQNWYLNPLVLLRFKSQLSGGLYRRQGQDIDFDNTGMDRRMRDSCGRFRSTFYGYIELLQGRLGPDGIVNCSKQLSPLMGSPCVQAAGGLLLMGLQENRLKKNSTLCPLRLKGKRLGVQSLSHTLISAIVYK